MLLLYCILYILQHINMIETAQLIDGWALQWFEKLLIEKWFNAILQDWKSVNQNCTMLSAWTLKICLQIDKEVHWGKLHRDRKRETERENNRKWVWKWFFIQMSEYKKIRTWWLKLLRRIKYVYIHTHTIWNVHEDKNMYNIKGL